MLPLNRNGLIWISLCILCCGLCAVARAQAPPVAQTTGSITGLVVDQTGTGVAGAQVTVAAAGGSSAQKVFSDDDGRFSFSAVAPGSFQLAVTAEGFTAKSYSGVLHAGEAYTVPQIVLSVASVVTEVRVVPSQAEIAEDQIKQEEAQRVLGIVPNFYVSYIPNAAPLTPKQKFELAWKSTLDPVTFGVVGAIAGVEQWQNYFSGYGPGTQGYGKRYGAAYADVAVSTYLGGAILPSLFKQDPRFFYKGTGSKRSRVLYALANAVICKGDNGHWQANYSNIVGNLAAGGISNLYYPAQDRNSVSLTFESALVGIGATAGTDLLQEFVFRRLTSRALHHHSDHP